MDPFFLFFLFSLQENFNVANVLSLNYISRPGSKFPFFSSIILLDQIQNISLLSVDLLSISKKISIFLIYFSSIIILDLIQNGSLLSLLSWKNFNVSNLLSINYISKPDSKSFFFFSFSSFYLKKISNILSLNYISRPRSK